MTIRTKLTINVIIVVIVISAVAVTGFLGMRFIKERLTYLTEKSTPYQMRTLDFQRTIQAATADLIKVGASVTKEEFASASSQADKTLLEVKTTQATLETMGGDKLGAHDDLQKIADELKSATSAKLKAEEDAHLALKGSLLRLKESSNRLRDLDGQIKQLQLTRSAAFSTAIDDREGVSGKVRSLDGLKSDLRELKQALADKRSVDAQAVAKRIAGNGFLRAVPAIRTEAKAMQTAMDEAGKLKGEEGFDTKLIEVIAKADALTAKLTAEAEKTETSYSDLSTKQGNMMTQASIASTVLAGNSELIALGLTVEALTTRLFTADTAKELDAIGAEINATYGKLGKAQQGVENMLKKLGATKELQGLKNTLGALVGVREAIFAKEGIVAKISNELSLRAQATAVMGKLRDVVQKQAEKGKEKVTTAQGEQEKSIATVNQMVRFSSTLIAGIGLAAIAIGIIFGLWIYRSIARPLNGLILASEQVAKGDLTTSLVNTSNDEVGKVQGAVGEMVHNLKGIVEKILGATQNLASSSEELSATAIALEQGANRQSSQVEQVAAAMEEMNQTTVEVARNSLETFDAADKMKAIAGRGKNAMETTMAEMNRFADTVREAATMVEGLGQQSEQINEVVTLIKDIADQTNLLALNAAIEAARAGDQGRGFAVVADNVRSLAERTSNATEEIAATVRTMQGSVSKSVAFMQEERDSVNGVQSHIRQTLTAIDEIVAYVSQVTDMVQRIAVAAEEQSSTSADVSQNMLGIQDVTRELSNSFADIKSSSEGLSHLAAELKDMMAWFKV